MDIKNKEEKLERESIVLKNDLQAAQIQIDRLTRKLEEREIEIDKLRFIFGMVHFFSPHFFSKMNI